MDISLCAEVDGKIVGAVWVRNIKGYGSIDDDTPEFAISLYKDFRGYGIGSEMMTDMLNHLKKAGYKKSIISSTKR